MFSRSLSRQAANIGNQVAKCSRIASLSQVDTKLQVRWEDGEQASFSYVWLRDWAPSARPLHLNELTLGILPKSCELEQEGKELAINWPPWTTSNYTSEWLREQAELFKTAEAVTASEHQERAPQPLTEVDHFDNLAKPTDIARSLARDGVVQLSDTENVLDTVKLLLGMDGRIVHEHEHECSVTGLHTGCAHMTNVPHYMIIRPVCVNGCGTFQLVDGHHAANECWLHHPAEFSFLAGTDIVYKDGNDVNAAKHPVINLSKGQVKQVIFNNAYRSPCVPPSRMTEYYTALKTYNNLCYKYTIEVRPKVGELLLIDNHRILHGNTSFNSVHNKDMHAKVQELYISTEHIA